MTRFWFHESAVVSPAQTPGRKLPVSADEFAKEKSRPHGPVGGSFGDRPAARRMVSWRSAAPHSEGRCGHRLPHADAARVNAGA